MTLAPERRAELRRAVDQCEVAGEWLKVEHEVIGHLLDATEPVGDADTRLLIDKLTALIPWAEDHSSDVASAIALAVALIERLARERGEVQKQRVRVDCVARIPFGPPEDEDE